MPNWTAFIGLTGVVLVCILFLTRLTAMQFRVGTASSEPDRAGPADDPGVGPESGFDEEASGREESTDVPAESAVDASTSPVDRSASPADRTEPEDSGESGNSIGALSAEEVAERDWGAQTGTGAANTADTGTGGLGEWSPFVLLANVAVTQGVFLALVVIGALIFEIPWEAFGGAMSPVLVGLGFGFGVVLYGANRLAEQLADAAGAAYDEELRGALAPESAMGWLVLLGVVLPIIAGFEELLFRGVLIGVVSEAGSMSPWLLAGGSSLLFGLAHSAQGRYGMVVTGGMGLVLAGAFIVSDSLLLVAVAHYVLNALEFVLKEGFDR